MAVVRPFDMIKDLTDEKQLWKIAVRVIDLWYPNPGHLEMIFMDMKGDRIQVTVKQEEFVKWNEKLTEQTTYVIHNFKLGRNDLKFKQCDHPYRLYFTSGTTLKEKEIADIPPMQYQFKNFSDILAGNFRKDLLVDIIGAVDKIGTLQPNAEPKRAAFNIKSLSGDVIQCTLWEDYADKFVTYYNQRKLGETIVIILTHARIKEAQGNYLPTVSNAWNGSKLLINEDIVDIQNFKTSFEATEFCASSSQTMTQLSACTQMSAYSQFSEQERFFYNAQVKSISDINGLASTKEITAVTVGTTGMHMPGKNGWYYKGCSRCTKSVEAQEGGQYKCKDNHLSDTWVPRYKLEIKVVHKKDSGRFIFWDSDCAEMIGMSALELRNKMIEAGEDDDPMAYPEPLDRVLARTLALKVRVQPIYHNSSVIKYSQDKQTIQTILDQLLSDEETSKLHKGQLDVDEAVKYVTDATNLDKSNSDANQCMQFDTQSLSATGDHDPDLLGSFTPAKRVSDGLGIDEPGNQDLPSAQLSTTKLAKHIKTE